MFDLFLELFRGEVGDEAFFTLVLGILAFGILCLVLLILIRCFHIAFGLASLVDLVWFLPSDAKDNALMYVCQFIAGDVSEYSFLFGPYDAIQWIVRIIFLVVGITVEFAWRKE